jgi:hypothetical protein
MQDTPSDEKSNHPKREWHFPRIVEVFYPRKIRSEQDRRHWIEAMLLDGRLGERTKNLLVRLALHLNLETGRLDPTVDLLALEVSIRSPSENEASARRMARRHLEEAEKIGWAQRTGRHAGYRLARSNSYRLTIPKDIHPDKSGWASGQIEPPVRTIESGRMGKENEERYYKKGTFDKRQGTSNGYTQKDLSLVKDILAERPLQVDRVLERARELGAAIDTHALGQMVVDGGVEFDAGFIRANPAHYVGADQLSMSED